MMGSGKTTVGRLLAARLGWRFIDTDLLIARSAGMPIPRIFQARGEAGFRALESRVLRRIEFKRPAVVATGGGLVTRAANRAFMRRKGLVVHLRVGQASLAKRLGSGAGRPLLQSGGLKALKSLARKRRKLYATADFSVSGLPAPKAVAASLLRTCQRRGLVLR